MAPPKRFAVVTFNEIPAQARSHKYDVLGRLGVDDHRRYCERHGYDFVSEVPVDPARPSCWAKLPAVAEALRDHEWVLWADSDALFPDHSIPLERFVVPDKDLVVQYQEDWWEEVGIPDGTERFPINSGVFLIRACEWSRRFLDESYGQERFVTGGDVWDGIGDQEGMNHVIRGDRRHRDHIAYVRGLQTSPRQNEPGFLAVHFYGNHALHRIPIAEADEVLARWEAALTAGAGFPADIRRFHWCCIQNLEPGTAPMLGDLETYRYSPNDLRAGA